MQLASFPGSKFVPRPDFHPESKFRQQKGRLFNRPLVSSVEEGYQVDLFIIP